LSLLSGIVFSKNQQTNINLLYVSAGLGAIGFIVHFDSYKWLKRASFETTLEGVKLKVE